MSAVKPSPNVVKAAAETIRAQWSAVWPHIGRDLRCACVDQRALVVAAMQDTESVSVDWIDSLRDALHREFDLLS